MSDTATSGTRPGLSAVPDARMVGPYVSPFPVPAPVDRCERCGVIPWRGGHRLGIMLDGQLTASRMLCSPCLEHALTELHAGLRRVSG